MAVPAVPSLKPASACRPTGPMATDPLPPSPHCTVEQKACTAALHPHTSSLMQAPCLSLSTACKPERRVCARPPTLCRATHKAVQPAQAGAAQSNSPRGPKRLQPAS